MDGTHIAPKPEARLDGRQFVADAGFFSADLEALDALVLVTDSEGRIVGTNRGFERVTGYAGADLRGHLWWEVLTPPEARELSRTRFEAQVAAAAASIVEHQWIAKSGEIRHVSCSYAVLAGEGPSAPYVIATGFDVTSRYKSERVRVRLEERFRLVWEGSHEPMCLARPDGVILEANPAFALMAGRQHASLAGTRLSDLNIAANADGSSRWIEVSKTALETPGQPDQFLSIFRDINERQGSAEELARARESAESASRDLIAANRYLEETGSLAHEMAERATSLAEAKSEFLANMTHEIRTPLNGIMGMLDLAMLGELAAEQREYLHLARSSADTLLNLVDDVLKYARYEAGKLALNPSEFSLRSLLQQVLGPLAERAAAKHLPLEWSVDASVPELLHGDAERLGQVLTRLIGNAIKFTPAGKVAVQVRATARSQSNAEVHFVVADTGIGVAKEKRRVIFQPFAQADGSTTREYGGAGLGLPIASALVELMGGRIWLESKPGEGSEFHFTVTLDVPRRSSTPADAEKHQRRVLVAEDNIVNQRLATRLLEKEGYSVEVAASGRQALELLERNHFDLVLMDIQMPELDGWQTTAQIRKNERGSLRRLPIVAITAQASESDRRRCFEAGMDAYITKPVRVPELMNVIHSVVPGGSLMNTDPQRQGSSVEEQLRQLDEAVALSRVGGDFDLLREVVELFLNDYPQALEKIRTAVAAHDPTGVEHHAHSLKGSVSTFGAKRAFDAALALERKGRSGDLTNVEEGFSNLECALGALRPELEEIQTR